MHMKHFLTQNVISPQGIEHLIMAAKRERVHTFMVFFLYVRREDISDELNKPLEVN